MIPDPALARIEADIAQPAFASGLQDGRWRILSFKFPILDFTIAATEPDGKASEYGFRAKLSNFPATAPHVRIWDHGSNTALPAERRPKGGARVAKTFQVWGDDTVYRPWERITGPHNNIAATLPHLAWRSDRHISFILRTFMQSLIATLSRTIFGPAPEVVCSTAVWSAGVAELRKRTLGASRESGAFLLGRKSSRRTIEEFVYYDDIDPHALDTGIVIIDGRKLGALWEHCRKTGREVVADIHVHPASFQQSPSDRANPVIAEIGHIAMILPHYARRATRPGGIGIFQYLGARRWKDRSREAFSPLHVGWSPR